MFQTEKEEILDILPLKLKDYNHSKTNDLIVDNYFENHFLATNYRTMDDIINYDIFHIPNIIPGNNYIKNEENQKNQKILLFNVEKKDENEHLLRGRKRKSLDPNQLYKVNIHSKWESDNILRKIQVHYLSFIIDFSNDVLKEFAYKKEDLFFDIDYKIKEKVNQKFIAELKGSDIGNVLCQNISPKYSTYRKDRNKIIYYKAIENEIIKYLFSINYLELFNNVYYKNEKKYSFKFKNYYGIINLSNVKTFRDLLDEKAGENKDYRDKFKACVNKNFIK